MHVAWIRHAKAMEMEEEMRGLLEGALPNNNCQDAYYEKSKKLMDTP